MVDYKKNQLNTKESSMEEIEGEEKLHPNNQQNGGSRSLRDLVNIYPTHSVNVCILNNITLFQRG